MEMGRTLLLRKLTKKAKNAGKKAKWSQSIIIGCDYYKKTLTFTNVKTQKNGQIYGGTC